MLAKMLKLLGISSPQPWNSFLLEKANIVLGPGFVVGQMN